MRPYIGILALSFCFVLVLIVYRVPQANVPVFPEPISSEQYEQITAPETQHAYYGTLSGFPHTYEIVADAPLNLSLLLAAPMDTDVQVLPSAIIVRAEPNGRVHEVTRIALAPASWRVIHEPYGNNRLLAGPQFRKELDSGTYRIEVHTPDNEARYVLFVGTQAPTTPVSYAVHVTNIAGTKAFLSASQLAVFMSPVVFTPLLVAVLICALGLCIFRQRLRRSAV